MRTTRAPCPGTDWTKAEPPGTSPMRPRMPVRIPSRCGGTAAGSKPGPSSVTVTTMPVSAWSSRTSTRAPGACNAQLRNAWCRARVSCHDTLAGGVGQESVVQTKSAPKVSAMSRTSSRTDGARGPGPSSQAPRPQRRRRSRASRAWSARGASMPGMPCAAASSVASTSSWMRPSTMLRSRCHARDRARRSRLERLNSSAVNWWSSCVRIESRSVTKMMLDRCNDMPPSQEGSRGTPRRRIWAGTDRAETVA